MVDDPLGPLRDAPLPPLAPAATLRARGEQRRRRQRVGLAGATAVVLALAGVTGFALADGSDELRPAPFAGESPQPDVLWDALLDPEDVEPVLGGDWDDLRGGESSFSASLEGCPETPLLPFRSAGRFLTDGTTVLAEDVTLLADTAAADARYQELLSMVRGCAEAGSTYRLLDSGGPADPRVTGEQSLAGEPTRPFSVERVGRAVVTVVLDGRPELDEALTAAAAAKVRAVLGEDALPATIAPTASSAPTASATADWSLAEAFLPAEEAARAEEPGWSVVEPFEPDDATPAADPCGEKRIPFDEAVRDQGERAMSSAREAGGSSLLQEVYRYDSTADAVQAFAEYEQRYARCAEVPNPEADGPGWTTRSEVVDRESGPTGSRLLVRRVPCSPEGACTQHFSTYEMVVQQADAVSVVGYAIGEDGDPAEGAQALIEAVQERLREVVVG